MCNCKREHYNYLEYNTIISNDYVYCQGYYDNIKENLKEYWDAHKSACDRNNLENECDDKQCKKYI